MFHLLPASDPTFAAQALKSISVGFLCIREGYTLWQEAYGSIWNLPDSASSDPRATKSSGKRSRQ